MPRMRPLGDPTLSFGGEWSFSLPHVDFRTGFPALYAAVLETFCVNRWRKTVKQRAARRPAQSQASFRVPPAAPISAESQADPIAPPSPVRPIAAAICSTPRERKIGAACALAGATVLSWIVLGHLPPSFEEQHAARIPVPRESTEGVIKPAEPPVQIAMPASTPAIADTAQTAIVQVQAEAVSAAAASEPLAVAAINQSATKDVSPVETLPDERVAAASAPILAAARGKSETNDVTYVESRVAQPPAIASVPAPVAAKDKPATKLASALPLVTHREGLSPPSEENAPMPRRRAETAVRRDTAVGRAPLPATLPRTAHADQASDQSVADASNTEHDSLPAPPPAKPDPTRTAFAASKPAAQPRNYGAQIPGYAKDTTWVNHLTQRRITDAPDQFGM